MIINFDPFSGGNNKDYQQKGDQMKKQLFSGIRVELAERVVHPLDLIFPPHFLRGKRNEEGEDVFSLTIDEAAELSILLGKAIITAQQVQANLGKE